MKTKYNHNKTNWFEQSFSNVNEDNCNTSPSFGGDDLFHDNNIPDMPLIKTNRIIKR